MVRERFFATLRMTEATTVATDKLQCSFLLPERRSRRCGVTQNGAFRSGYRAPVIPSGARNLVGKAPCLMRDSPLREILRHERFFATRDSSLRSE
jgi:hypothetical protein